MTSPWFTNSAVKNPQAKWRLFCFPFAGGSGHEFRTWGEQLPTVELFGVLYPGRASRFRTPLIDNMEQMVAELQQEILPFQDRPFAFFGHSLGALIAFELTRSLRKAGLATPELLLVSACEAPHLQPVPPLIHDLPNDEFIQEIKDMGGTPEAILNNAEMLGLILPIMRADLKLLETYRYEAQAPLAMPLYTVGGIDDTVAERENVLEWKQHTSAEWQSQFFKGGHFYFREDPQTPLFAYLQTLLAKAMTAV